MTNFNKKKVYISCGELKVIILCDNPVDGCKNAYEKFGQDKELDNFYFYLSEQGFREGEEADYKVPVDMVISGGEDDKTGGIPILA